MTRFELDLVEVGQKVTRNGFVFTIVEKDCGRGALIMTDGHVHVYTGCQFVDLIPPPVTKIKLDPGVPRKDFHNHVKDLLEIATAKLAFATARASMWNQDTPAPSANYTIASGGTLIPRKGHSCAWDLLDMAKPYVCEHSTVKEIDLGFYRVKECLACGKDTDKMVAGTWVKNA